MKWYNKLFNSFKEKSIVTGGFEVLEKLFGANGEWPKQKAMSQYAKSLYVYACVRKIAEKTASQEIKLYKITNSKGDKEEVTNHPALDLLYKVNPFQTKSEFIEMTMINLKLSGDAFWWKIRNTRGQVVELWNLRPDLVTIVKHDTEFISGYKFRKNDGTDATFNTEDIIHFKYPNPLDMYYGLSPVASAQVRIDTESYASQYQRDFFLNNARPDAILKFPNSEVTEEQKKEIRKGWEKRYGGVGKNSKIAILEGDVEYQQLSLSQREMDYIDSMKFTRDDILVAFAVPKAIVAITDDVNRANAETSMHIFLSETIAPELNRLEEKINEQLIIPDFGDNLFIEFPNPTPEDRELVLKEYETGIKSGYMLINEVREKENLPPVDGGWDLYKPLNMLPVGQLKNTPKKSKENYLFRGKGMLKTKLELTEDITKLLYKEINKTKEVKKVDNTNVVKNVIVKEEEKPETEIEKIPKSLIGNDDLKIKYADVINKQIDSRSIKLKKDMDKVANDQKKGVLKIVNEIELPKKSAEGPNEKAEDLNDFKNILGSATVKKLDEFFSKEDKVMAEFILPFIETSVKDAGLEALLLINPEGEFEMTARLQKTIQARADKFGLEINETTKGKLAKKLSQGISDGEGISELTDRVEEIYKEYPSYRSERIARTETTASNNEGALEGYKQSDVATHKEWIATKDSSTRPEHVALNGQIVKLDKAFSNGLQYPQEPNCRCVIAPAFEE